MKLKGNQYLNHVNCRALYRALQILNKLAATKTALPVRGSVCLHTRDGVLNITATNSIQTLTAELFCEGDISACVPCNTLAKLIRPLSKKTNETVDFELIDDNAIALRADGIAERLDAIDPDGFPVFTNPKWEPVAIWDAGQLCESLHYVLPAMDNDKSRPQLCGIYFDKIGKLVASNGHRVQIATLPSHPGDSMLVPAAATLLLPRLLKGHNQVIVARADDRLKFRVGHWTLETKLIDANFPPYRQAIPNPERLATRVAVKTREMISALNRIRAVSKDCGIRMTINSVIEMTLNDPNVGDITVIVEPVANDHTGDNLEVVFNSVYLLDALGKSSDQAKLNLSGPLDPLRVDLDDGRIAVVMPMRV